MPLKLQVMLQIVLIKRLLFTRVLIRHEMDESKYKLPVYSENRWSGLQVSNVFGY